LHKSIVKIGHISIGDGTIIQDNVILGHKINGKIIIGTNSFIRSGTVIYSNVNIGCNFKTGHNVIIRENTIIENNVLLGSNTVVDGNCTLGSNISIQTGAYVTAYTTIEDGVFLGPCSVTTNDKYMEANVKLKGPTLKSGARIGANCTILPAITIGDGAVVGAGAVVTKDVYAGDTVIGNPAISIKEYLKDRFT